MPHLEITEELLTVPEVAAALHSLPEDRRVAAEKLEAHLFGPKLDPNSSGRKYALPGFVGAEEVVGRGDRI